MSEFKVDGDAIAEVVAYLNGHKTAPAKRMADAVLRLLNRHYQDAAALEAAREDAWQPIETAPKEQAVLVTFAAGDIPAGQVTMPGVMVAYWDAYYAIGGNGHDGIGRGWVDAHSGEGCHLHYGHPTHWRPLTAPPAIDQARGKGGAGK